MNNFDPIKGQVKILGTHANGHIDAMFCDGKGVVPMHLTPEKEEGPGGAYHCEITGDGPTYEAELIPLLGQGPPKVNSKAYQEGWDAIFGAKDS